MSWTASSTASTASSTAPSRGPSRPRCSRSRSPRRCSASATTRPRSSRRGRTMVPNDFTVELGQHDFDRLAMYAEPLGAELAAMVREHAEEQGYQFVGPCRSSASSCVDDLDTGSVPGAQPGDGRRARRDPAGTVTAAPRRGLGGARDRALDAGAHASAHRPGPRRRGRPPPRRPGHLPPARRDRAVRPAAASTDLGSTNGTFVDGQRVAVGRAVRRCEGRPGRAHAGLPVRRLSP